jgi:formate dehydrogenase major subunit/NADH-quinone oxidoreductase subunit G
MGGTAPTSSANVFGEIASNTPGYLGLSYAALRKESAIATVSIKPAFIIPQSVTPIANEQGKLALVTGSALYHSGTQSQYGEGPMHVCPEAYIEVSRTDATAHKIVENDLITVSSTTGSMQLKVKITPRMPAGVVFAPYHFSAAPINTIWNGLPVTLVSLAK